MNLQESNFQFSRRPCFKSVHDEPLEYNLIKLNDATSIVKLSFIVHRSINPLDLSIFEKPRKISNHYEFPSCKIFIITEEDCKKAMIPKRTLLYSWHLDLARTLEMRLRKVPSPQFKSQLFHDVDSFHLRDIYLRNEFYLDILRSFLVESIENSDEKVDLIRKSLKAIKTFFGDLISFYPKLFPWILNIIYKECNDSQVVKEVLSAFDFKKWVLSHYYGCKPEILDFFLYHARCSGYVVLGCYSRGDPINCCIMYKKYSIVAVLLKYINTPRFLEADFSFNSVLLPKPLTRNNQNSMLRYYSRNQPAREGRMSIRRNFLAVMILDLFENLSSEEGVQALRLLWRAIPDTFLTLNEWMLASGGQQNPDILQKVYRLYSEIIEEDTSISRPRPLRQYCRITIRQALYDCQKLPNGIELLNLDSKSKAYLRLEK